MTKDASGKLLTGLLGVTFALYKDEVGGAPVWLETQNVQADSKGHYTVSLGATQPSGLPLDAFTSTDARWLGVQVEGQAEQPRTLLLSVPYALKAGDAQTIGGLPPSAFVLAAPATAGSVANAASAAAATLPAAAPPTIGGGGTLNFVPLWTPDGNTLGNSVLFQSGSGTTGKVGINTTTPSAALDVKGGGTIRGTLNLPAQGAATATKGFNSQPITQVSSAFNSSTVKAVNQTFAWQTQPVGNNTSSPTGTLALLFASGPNPLANTGLSIASNGLMKFADGQTFPGTGTITGVTTDAGSGLSGGGTSGSLSLALTNTCAANQVLQWSGSVWACSSAGTGTVTGVTAGTGLTGGGTGGSLTLNVDTTKVPQLAAANTFTGSQTVNGNLSATGVVSGNSFNIGSDLFAFGQFGNYNAFLGYAGNSAGTGTNNTAIGRTALASITTGSSNTAAGASALFANTTGSNNTAMGVSSLGNNISGQSNTATGYNALAFSTAGQLNTANGAQALQTNNTGSFNTATGASALFSNTIGNYNTASGLSALGKNDVGNGNTATGALALQNSTANYNTATGYNALAVNTTGDYNTATGASVLSNDTTGGYNTASGYLALNSNTGGFLNTASGFQALFRNTTGNQNVAEGYFALGVNTTGSNNTGVGTQAMANIGTGSNNTAIGFNAGVAAGQIYENLTNTTAVGANASVTESNALVLGSINGVNTATADTLVGIGITAPTFKLHVGAFNNSFRVEGPATSGTGGLAASFGGYGDIGIDAFGTASGRFVVKESGKVGIGTPNPDALLSVNGSADKVGGGSWGTYSDGRLKNLNGDFRSGLSEILKLHPIRYRYKEENALGIRDHDEHIGFVAQDVQKVIPEAVTENSKGYMLVNNDPILWAMLNAIQQQQREIKELRAQLRKKAIRQAGLESRLARLERDWQSGSSVASYRTSTEPSLKRRPQTDSAAVSTRGKGGS